MSDLQVTCINKSNNSNAHEHITHIGNIANNWRKTREEVIAIIDAGTSSFFVMDIYGKKAYVGVVREAGKAPFLRTHADGRWNNNLLALTVCPALPR